MARSKSVLPRDWNLGDLLKHFGGIAPERIRVDPPPGRATERDVTQLNDRSDRLYELVDGVLVAIGVQSAEEARALVLRRRYGLVCIFVDSFDDVRTVITDARTQMGNVLRHTIAATLKRSADVEEFRHTRRKAHIELGRLSAAGASVAAGALMACVTDAANAVLVRAEAAYSLGKIRPTPPGVADFLLDRIDLQIPPAIVTSTLAALLQLDPPVDEQLAIWTNRAAALESVCREVDRRSETESGPRGAPRARKYLEALIARWRATSS